MYQAIIWDFGGTLFDTLTGVGTSIQKALLTYGVDEQLEKIVSKMRPSVVKLIDEYIALYGLGEEFIHMINQLDSQINPVDVSPIFGSRGICIEARRRGAMNFIVSHRDDSLLKFLEFYDMLELFDEIVTSERALSKKPAPDAFHYLIEKYRLDASRVIAIGDRDCDIEASKRAGIACCKINSGCDAKELSADFEIKELIDFAAIVGLERFDVIQHEARMLY